jgi:hypothetical protein
MMKDFSNTEKRVAFFKKQLEKAMPAVRSGTTNKSPLVAPQFKHV